MAENEGAAPGEPPGNMVVPWKSIALVATCVGATLSIGSGAVVVLVARKQHADGLATTALELAVIAFVIQLLVFVAQVFASNRQSSRNEEIYARMNGLLEGLRGTAQGTQETLQDQFGVLLAAATRTASETVAEQGEDEKFDAADFKRSVLERVSEEADSKGVAIALGHLGPTYKPSEDDRAIIFDLSTFPDQDKGMEAVRTLEDLSAAAVNLLLKFANDEIVSRQNGNTVGLHKAASAAWTNELEQQGLVERVGEPARNGSKLTVLTPKGRAAARLLSARGKPPDWLLASIGGPKPVPGDQPDAG